LKLQGALTKEASALANVPTIWRQCLEGRGEINLSGVPVLSQHHYLWSPHKFTAKLTGLLASATLSSNVEPLRKEDYPKVFQSPAFKGEVFVLDEMVVDVIELVRELVKANQDAVFKIEPLCDEELKFDEDGKLVSATVYMAGKSVEITAQQFIFAAGAGNEVMTKKLNDKDIVMQRRPLHMVMVKTPFDLPLYAHCLGLGTKPRLTITTHYTQDGSTVWYLGGQLAEDGVRLDGPAQIKAAQTELRALFPWLDFSTAAFSSFVVDRAEPQQKNGVKPDSAFVRSIANMMIAWPTKLALAPKLANEVLSQLKAVSLSPQLLDTRELRAWPMPPITMPIWEEAFCKHTV